jgi:hypothetical protein
MSVRGKRAARESFSTDLKTPTAYLKAVHKIRLIADEMRASTEVALQGEHEVQPAHVRHLKA